MPTIALDFDDTLADTISLLLQWIEDNHGYRITDENLAGYELGANREQTSAIVEAFLADDAHGRIEAMEGAQESCRRFVAQGYRLIVDTARKPDHSRQTVELVERLFPDLITDIRFVGLPWWTAWFWVSTYVALAIVYFLLWRKGWLTRTQPSK